MKPVLYFVLFAMGLYLYGNLVAADFEIVQLMDTHFLISFIVQMLYLFTAAVITRAVAPGMGGKGYTGQVVTLVSMFALFGALIELSFEYIASMFMDMQPNYLYRHGGFYAHVRQFLLAISNNVFRGSLFTLVWLVLEKHAQHTPSNNSDPDVID